MVAPAAAAYPVSFTVDGSDFAYEIKSLTPPGKTTGEIDTTNMSSTIMEFLAVPIPEITPMSGTCTWDGTYLTTGTTYAIVVTLSNSTTLSFSGFFTEFTPQELTVTGEMLANFSLRPTTVIS